MDLQAPIASIMSTDLKTAHPDDAVSVLDTHFKEHRIHHVPVINADRNVVGIIAKSDFVYLLRGYTNNQVDSFREAAKMRSFKVEEIMASEVETIQDSATVKDAVSILAENRFNSLPVVDDQNKLVGIVTTHDIIDMVNNL